MRAIFAEKIRKMKKFITLAIASIISLQFGFSSNDISSENPPATMNMTGKVIDKTTGETLAGVMVEIDGTDKQVFSDFDGNFTFENLAAGEYKLTVSLISYEEGQASVALDRSCNKEVEVKLEAKK